MSNIERQYRDILESLNLTQHVTKPTRVTRSTKSLIDYVISNDPSRVFHTDVLAAPSVSDHDAVYAIINAKVTRYAPRHKYIRNEKQLDMQAFKQDFLVSGFECHLWTIVIGWLLNALNSLVT